MLGRSQAGPAPSRAAKEDPRDVSGGRICSTCGSENDAGALSCRSCGAPLHVPIEGTREERKIVTVLFSDVTGFTVLGDELDAESVRRIMSRYFEEMRAVLERHGGTVEKFIGDAIMAVFGVPKAHEDDALRAVRAAVEMLEALGHLNEELRNSWGITLTTRTGVNTGEVIAAEPGLAQPLVAGDAVNVASRLERAAEPGGVLIGDVTYQLVRDAIVAEEVPPLALRGKARAVPAWKLLEVHPEFAEWSRRLGSPLVGRDRELELLRNLFDRTQHEGVCRLVTLLGPAGIGKSRLTSDFVALVRDHAQVVEGRCLPYGDGITFWPVVGVLRGLAGIGDRDAAEQARSKVETLVAPLEDGALIGQRVAGLLGLAEATPGIQQTFWAVRKLLQQLAMHRPLLIVFEDIQWGESTFLDLLEYLTDWVGKAPVLLLCLARSELLDVRPGWMAAKPLGTLLRLEPLSELATEGLIGNLIGEGELPQEAEDRIQQLAEGNPLFVEETLRMFVDDGLLRRVDGRWTVEGDLSRLSIPPTIHALVSARLDRLEPEELAMIERASVIGRVFWWGAVAELSPAALRPRVARHLQSLMRKELILPDRSALGEEDAFRFAHILIRDGAYQRIPKATRAELHGRLADWVEARTRDQVGEYEEIIGYHLEQAYRSQLEIGRVSREMDDRGYRAAVVLASAGLRAFGREDAPAAVNLLSRAADLLPPKAPQRMEVLSQLAFALMDLGDFERLSRVVAEASEVAGSTDDERLRAHALILELCIRLFTSPEGWAGEAEREASRAIATFEERGDERGLAKAWSLLGLVNVTRARFARAEEAWAQAALHAGLAGSRREELEALSWVLLSVWAGPEHAERGRERCREVEERARGDHKGTASAMFMRAVFEAGLGNSNKARRLIADARGLLQEVGHTVWLAGPFAQMAGLVEMACGDPAAAERELRSGYDRLREMGEMAWLPTLVAFLAEAIYVQGRYEDADRCAEISKASAGREDAYSQVLWRAVRGRVLARRGAGEEALELTAEARAAAEATDSPELRAQAMLAQAEVLRLSGRPADAGPRIEEAAGLFERKGNIVAAGKARALLG